ncbi:MAG: sulfatase-like hydrolase/transferase [Bdellovibrio sp.]
MGFALFLFELLRAAVSFQRSGQRFRNLDFIDSGLLSYVAFFGLRVLVLYLILGLGLGVALWLMKTQRRWWLWCLTFFVSLSVWMFVQDPVIFDDWAWSYPLQRRAAPFMNIYTAWVPLAAFFSISTVQIFRVRTSIIARGSWVLVWILFAWSLAGYMWTKEAQSPVTMAPSGDPKKPHQLFFLMDSLSPRYLEKQQKQMGPGLKQFLKKSVEFSHVVTPLAQTHASLSAVFSGLYPPHSGIRSNLPPEILDRDFLPPRSLLKVYHEQGYEIRYLIDVMEYTYLMDSDVWGRVDAPEAGASAILMSLVFKGYWLWPFFKNPLGTSILPDLFSNSAFRAGYQTSDFTKKVLREVQGLRPERPTVLIIHQCGLHWPGHLPYPYYIKNKIPKDALSPFSYTEKTGAFRSKIEEHEWGLRSSHNKKIYEQMLKLSIDHFLNPIFNLWLSSGLRDTSVVSLFSDHGEDFWSGQNRYPKFKSPQHGGALIGASRSEFAVWRFFHPKVNPTVVEKFVSLVDVLPTHLDFSGFSIERQIDGRSHRHDLENQSGNRSDRAVYSETGLWPIRFFSGQFLPSSKGLSLSSWYSFDSMTNLIYLKRKHVPVVTLQKQRAIYLDGLRYTVYPSETGYLEHLCNLQADPACLVNLARHQENKMSLFRREMLKFAANDIKNGLFPLFQQSLNEKSFVLFDNNRIWSQNLNRPHHSWALAMAATHDLHRFRDYRNFIESLNAFLQQAEIEDDARDYFLRLAGMACQNRLLFPVGESPGSLKTLLRLVQSTVAMSNSAIGGLVAPCEPQAARRQPAFFRTSQSKEALDVMPPFQSVQLWSALEEGELSFLAPSLDLIVSELLDRPDASIDQKLDQLEQAFAQELSARWSRPSEYYFRLRWGLLAHQVGGEFRILREAADIIKEPGYSFTFVSEVLALSDHIFGPAGKRLAAVKSQIWGMPPGRHDVRAIEYSEFLKKAVHWSCLRSKIECRSWLAAQRKNQMLR